FFQPEDGIRVATVTGVQTCALPIWIVIQKLNIADQGRARKDRFKQVVTEQRVFRNASVQRFFKRIDIVQTLARIDSLAEEILIRSEERRVGKECKCEIVM